MLSLLIAILIEGWAAPRLKGAKNNIYIDIDSNNNRSGKVKEELMSDILIVSGGEQLGNRTGLVGEDAPVSNDCNTQGSSHLSFNLIKFQLAKNQYIYSGAGLQRLLSLLVDLVLTMFKQPTPKILQSLLRDMIRAWDDFDIEEASIKSFLEQMLGG
ncbi:hypothetical protein BY996DRAFT_6408956 [Phakopsora pachyrhizi]|nr:hypothetical protein BY996DRAFT_6408956 [Phakopsora pachyrhizi]